MSSVMGGFITFRGRGDSRNEEKEGNRFLTRAGHLLEPFGSSSRRALFSKASDTEREQFDCWRRGGRGRDGLGYRLLPAAAREESIPLLSHHIN